MVEHRKIGGMKLILVEAIIFILLIIWNTANYDQYIPLIKNSYLISIFFAIAFIFLYMFLHIAALRYFGKIPRSDKEPWFNFAKITAVYKLDRPVKLNAFCLAVAFPFVITGFIAVIGQVIAADPSWGFVIFVIFFFAAPSNILILLLLSRYRKRKELYAGKHPEKNQEEWFIVFDQKYLEKEYPQYVEKAVE